MANGKIKGNNYERVISKRLSLWLTNNERDDLIWHTHGSGSRFTNRMKKNKKTYGQDGDITSTCSGDSELFLNKISVELKAYKDINLWGLITHSTKGILGFWNQARKQSMACNKIPVLIIKQNNRPELLISTDDFYDIILKQPISCEPIMRTKISDTNVIFIWKLKDFLKLDPQDFLKSIQ